MLAKGAATWQESWPKVIPDSSKTAALVLAPNVKIGDKYRLVRRLGRGGMGEVWLARNEATGAQVALKALNAGVQIREDTLGRFRREARLGGLLSHRHIVQIFDLVEDAGSMVLVMELLRGENLDTYCARVGPLTTREAVSIVLPILSALQHAHDAGVVHRDVTPGNVFLAVDSDGHVIPKLVDFGIAKHLGGEFQTMEGEVLGTPSYMAPELIRGARDFNGTSDLFSIGILLYELITGAGPFQETTPAAALAAVLEKTVDPDDRIEPRVWVEISRALAKRPYERHGSARELATALASALGDTQSRDVNVTLQKPPLAPDDDELRAGSNAGLGNRALTGAATTHTQDTPNNTARRERRALVTWGAVGAAIAAALILAGLATVNRQAAASARPTLPVDEPAASPSSATPAPATTEGSSVAVHVVRPGAPASPSAVAATDTPAGDLEVYPVTSPPPPPATPPITIELPAKAPTARTTRERPASPRSPSPTPKKPVARSPGF